MMVFISCSKTIDNMLRDTHVSILKRTSVQKSNKNEIFMARVKNSSCLKFCTLVDPSKTRKTVYLFPQMCFFPVKNELFAFTL